MADLDDFFKKKDKKKKGEKKFAKANTDVLAKNLEQMAVKEEKEIQKEMSEMKNDSPNTPLNQQVSGDERNLINDKLIKFLLMFIYSYLFIFFVCVFSILNYITA